MPRYRIEWMHHLIGKYFEEKHMMSWDNRMSVDEFEQ
jgi:hypothetical protein